MACPSPGPCLKEPLLPWPLRPPGFWAVAGPSLGTDMAVVSLCPGHRLGPKSTMSSTWLGGHLKRERLGGRAVDGSSCAEHLVSYSAAGLGSGVGRPLWEGGAGNALLLGRGWGGQGAWGLQRPGLSTAPSFGPRSHLRSD